MHLCLQWCFGPGVSLSFVPVWSYLETKVYTEQGNSESFWIAGWASLEERFIICVPSNARITINIQVEVAAVLGPNFGHTGLFATYQDVNLYTNITRWCKGGIHQSIGFRKVLDKEPAIPSYCVHHKWASPTSTNIQVNVKGLRRTTLAGGWQLQDFQDVVSISSPFK